ncbi:MAG: hypothetical protein HZC19_00460 [Candidatus Omnitrophica bacterium]|nr:hypothetical protein [Candidatus Omnitrophota bacterium]
MRRPKRFKKVKIPPFLENLRAEILKRLIVLFVVFLFFVLSFLLVKAFLYRSDYFRLRAIEIKDASNGQAIASSLGNGLLMSYNGRNIFEVNISGIAKSLEASYPDAKAIVAKRALPDKIIINLKFRKAVAIVGDTRHYLLDEEGIVFSNGKDIEPSKGLPIISGLDVRNGEKGEKRIVQTKNLKTALDLLREMKKARFLSEHDVARIDVGDIADTAFYLKNGLEIRIGYEDLKERLTILRVMLKDPRLVVDKIEYIDLRFKDAVIGPKQ